MIYLYGAGHYDNVVGRNLICKANIGFKKHRIQEFVEKDNARAAFENMLDIVKKGDMVVITSVAAFDDGSDFSIMRKIRRLESIGVKLVVETEKNIVILFQLLMLLKQKKLKLLLIKQILIILIVCCLK